MITENLGCGEACPGGERDERGSEDEQLPQPVRVFEVVHQEGDTSVLERFRAGLGEVLRERCSSATTDLMTLLADELCANVVADPKIAERSAKVTVGFSGASVYLAVLSTGTAELAADLDSSLHNPPAIDDFEAIDDLSERGRGLLIVGSVCQDRRGACGACMGTLDFNDGHYSGMVTWVKLPRYLED